MRPLMSSESPEMLRWSFPAEEEEELGNEKNTSEVWLQEDPQVHVRGSLEAQQSDWALAFKHPCVPSQQYSCLSHPLQKRC